MNRKISNELPFDITLTFFNNLSFPDNFLPGNETLKVVVPAKKTFYRSDIHNSQLFKTTINIKGNDFILSDLRRVIDNQPITIGIKYSARSDNLKSSMSNLAGFYITNYLPTEVRILHKRPGLQPIPRAYLRANDGMTYQGSSASVTYYDGLSVAQDPFGSGGINIGDTLIFEFGTTGGYASTVYPSGTLEFIVLDPYIHNLKIGEISTSCEGVNMVDVAEYRLGRPNYKTGLVYYNPIGGTYFNTTESCL